MRFIARPVCNEPVLTIDATDIEHLATSRYFRTFTYNLKQHKIVVSEDGRSVAYIDDDGVPRRIGSLHPDEPVVPSNVVKEVMVFDRLDKNLQTEAELFGTN